MNESQKSAAPDLPTPEQLVGRQVRLLRQARGWSQLEIAQKMRAYGYQWSPATVTRLEAASRPIRVNELVDLAMLYEVPVAQFLEAMSSDFEWRDPEALQKEVAGLKREATALQVEMHVAHDARDAAAMHYARVAIDLARVEGRLGTLTRWLPEVPDSPQEPSEGGAEQ